MRTCGALASLCSKAGGARKLRALASLCNRCSRKMRGSCLLMQQVEPENAGLLPPYATTQVDESPRKAGLTLRKVSQSLSLYSTKTVHKAVRGTSPRQLALLAGSQAKGITRRREESAAEQSQLKLAARLGAHAFVPKRRIRWITCSERCVGDALLQAWAANACSC